MSEKNIDNSAKKTSIFVSVVASIIIFMGVALAVTSLVGGCLLIVSGILFLPKFRDILVNTGSGGSLNTHRNLKIAAWFFLIVGLFLSSSRINSQNLNEWNSQKQEIISQFENSINSNNLDEAKKTIDKFSSAVKNDSQFDALKSQYQAAVKKADAEKNKSQETISQDQKAQSTNENSSSKTPTDVQDKIKRVQLSAQCAGFYSGFLPRASQSSCAGTDMDSVLACRAWFTNEVFKSVMKANNKSQEVNQYIQNNRDEISRSYEAGYRDYKSGDTNVSILCKTYFDNVTDSVSNK
jgi:hypothetical protein